MNDFRQHEGWCPRGASPDGRRRLDIFPEVGGAFPLWERGIGCDPDDFSAGLATALYAWNEEGVERALPVGGTDAWVARGQELAQRAERESGATVVLLGPELLGPDQECLHCGPSAHQLEEATPLARLLSRLRQDYPDEHWDVKDVRRAEVDPRLLSTNAGERMAAEQRELERYEREPVEWIRDRWKHYLSERARTFGVLFARDLAASLVEDGHLTASEVSAILNDIATVPKASDGSA